MSPDEYANSYTIVRATWLSQKLAPLASLISALVILFVSLGALAFWSDWHHAGQWMAASGESVLQKKEFWRLWTTLLVHADLKHLLSNSLLLFILGAFLNGYFGFFLFPILAFLVGGAINYFVLKDMPPEIQLMGASGVVFWMAGAWLVLYFLLDRRRSLFQRGLRASGVGLALFMPAEAFDPNISYETHLLGFVVGMICGALYFWIHRKKLHSAEVIETIIEDEPPLQ